MNRTDVNRRHSVSRVYVLYFQDSELYIEKLLDLFNRFSKLVAEAFNDDPRFLTARDKVGEVHA